MKSQVTDVEQRYEEDFKRSRGNGLKTLFFIYKGSYGKLIGSAIAFAIKHSPCWILPIVTANIINLATGLTPAGRREIILNAVGIAVLLILNVPFNYLHVHLYSKAVRKSEAGLRLALVTKLQHLSISYHKETQSGRLQSKLMRDIEQFQTLSEQLFVNMVMIILTLAFTISVTLSKSIVVFVFFVLAVPVAVLIMMLFRKNFSGAVRFRFLADFSVVPGCLPCVYGHFSLQKSNTRWRRCALPELFFNNCRQYNDPYFSYSDYCKRT